MIKIFRSIRKSLLSDGKTKTYFKYAIGEIVLVVIGILIALSINNWNATNKSNHDKEVIVSKIKEEVKNNRQQLVKANGINQKVLKAFNAYSKFYNGASTEVITTPTELLKLQKEYPGFFRVKDSFVYDSQRYRYTGGTVIELELPDITSIAWETTRAINIANEFDYDCLYDLANTYNLQTRVKREIDKATDALLKNESEDLFKILKGMNQLELQLKVSYNEILATIDYCK